ncbi:MAG: hypothetical protein ACI4FX_01200 [Agathobacter sp.]
MRKQQKTQILKIVELLQQNFEKINQGHLRKNTDLIIDTLTDLQMAVIACGNSIEVSEGNNYPLIQDLEYLCDLFYQIGTEIQQGIEVSDRCQEVTQILHLFYKEIKDMPTRLEVLFMPYQVSMWDSLESVWLAARDDPTVDAYVMPIPYYDVLPNNTLGELHYEGDRYPEEVPVTDYQKYNIEERKPDIIFFHNPYDEMNTVTRVPECFFARHICKYTSNLVYIPYMASEEDGPSDGQTHTPGVLWADKVIVQEGNVYKNYCRGYTKFLKEQGIEDRFPSAEDKFLPLGSPKFDKLLNTKCELKDLPPKWQELIQKPDGSLKKVIIYNITIGTLLTYSEQLLKKITSAFDIFRQMKDEIVLIWRPHPLLLKTINSMRPDLRDAYLAIVEEYKQEGWGIYDDTPDPNLAMALSDAYYGDMSSLLTTYRATGKPILLQDVNII